MKRNLLCLFILVLAAGSLLAQNKKNEALVRSYFKAWNEGKTELLNQVCDPDFERNTAGVSDVRGLAALKTYVQRNREHMLRYKIEPREWISNRDGVAVSWAASFWATEDKIVSWTGISMFKVSGEKLTEEAVMGDRLKMYRQMGYTITAPEEKKE